MPVLPVRDGEVLGPGEQIEGHGGDLTGMPVAILDGKTTGNLRKKSMEEHDLKTRKKFCQRRNIHSGKWQCSLKIRLPCKRR